MIHQVQDKFLIQVYGEPSSENKPRFEAMKAELVGLTLSYGPNQPVIYVYFDDANKVKGPDGILNYETEDLDLSKAIDKVNELIRQSDRGADAPSN